VCSSKQVSKSLGISVSVVSDYRLDDKGSMQGRSKESSLYPLCSEQLWGSYPINTGVLSPGVKRGWVVTLTTHPLLVPRSRMSRSCISFPYVACMAVAGQLYFLHFRRQYSRLTNSLNWVLSIIIETLHMKPVALYRMSWGRVLGISD
jgi:hypothetical protein